MVRVTSSPSVTAVADARKVGRYGVRLEAESTVETGKLKEDTEPCETPRGAVTSERLWPLSG